jgi:hypothetical protein
VPSASRTRTCWQKIDNPGFIHPFKKRLAEYLEFFKLKILALHPKPLNLKGCQRLPNVGDTLPPFKRLL